jgi:hypothetical protein
LETQSQAVRTGIDSYTGVSIEVSQTQVQA